MRLSDKELYETFNNAISELLDDTVDGIYYKYILPVCDDVTQWRNAIINHWNGQKAFDNKNGNVYGRFNYYYFAQQDIDILNELFYIYD